MTLFLKRFREAWGFWRLTQLDGTPMPWSLAWKLGCLLHPKEIDHEER